MYATYSSRSAPVVKRPLGVWLLTIHAAVFAGFLPLLVKLWLLSAGQFNGEDVALFVIAMITNVAVLPLAYATWQGSPRTRWAFLGAVALHYGLEIVINLDAAALPLLDPDVAQRFRSVALRSALWVPIVVGYFLLPRPRAWFDAIRSSAATRRWHGEHGSNVAQAAAVAMMVAILIGGGLIAARDLNPGVDRAFTCLVSVLSGGGANCGGQAQTPPADTTTQAPPEAEEEDDGGGGFWSGALDVVQTGLDVVGLVPGVGEIADGANALISLGRGNYVDAALSAGSMIPFVGWGSTAAKWGKRGVDVVNAADAANDGRRVASRADDVLDAGSDIAKRADGEDVIPPCRIGMVPSQRTAGLAAPLRIDCSDIDPSTLRHPRSPDEYDDLARDPAHGNKIDDKGKWERKIGLELEQSGKLPGPIKRDPSGAAEFIDANGTPWDIKGFNSNFPPNKGGFRLDRSVAQIQGELNKGENVILDTTNLSPEHLQQLREAVQNNGWGDRVQWWP